MTKVVRKDDWDNELVNAGNIKNYKINEGLGETYEKLTLADAKVLAEEIKDALQTFVPDKNYLLVRAESGLGTNVFITFAKGKNKEEWPHQIMRNDPAFISLMVTADPKGLAMNKVNYAYTLKKAGIKPITDKTGTKDQVVAHIVKWFSANIDALNETK